MPQIDKKHVNWNTKQQQVINAFRNKFCRFFLHGGVRSGKSWIVAYLIDFICSRTPGMMAFVFRQTFESIKTDTSVIFKSNPGFLNGKGEWHEGVREFHYHNGSKIYFRHTKGSEHILGVTAGLIFFEQIELMAEFDFDLIKNTRLSQWGGEDNDNPYLERYKKEIFNGVVMRPKNYLFMTANPKAGWVKSRYIDNKIKDENEKISIFHMSTYDNLQNLGDDFILNMGSASDAFKRKYYDGSWEFNSGIIYSEFKDDDIADGGHVVTKEWEAANKFNASDVKTYLAIDPGYAKSKFAVLFVAILRDGTIYVFDEIVRNGAKNIQGKDIEEWEKVTPVQIARLIKEKYKDYAFTPSNVPIIDNRAKANEGGMGTIAGQFIKNGIPVTGSKKTKELDMIYKIKDLFKANKILVNARCEFFLKELGLFRWNESAKFQDKPLQEDNDLMDCLRYICAVCPLPLTNSTTYGDQYNQAFGNKQYENWIRSWYGKKPPKKRTEYGIANLANLK